MTQGTSGYGAEIEQDDETLVHALATFALIDS